MKIRHRIGAAWVRFTESESFPFAIIFALFFVGVRTRAELDAIAEATTLPLILAAAGVESAKAQSDVRVLMDPPAAALRWIPADQGQPAPAPEATAAIRPAGRGIGNEVDRNAFYGSSDEWVTFLLTGCDPRLIHRLGPQGRCQAK